MQEWQFRNRMQEFFDGETRKRVADFEHLVHRVNAVRDGLAEETEKVKEVVAKLKKCENANHAPVVRALFNPLLNASGVMATWRALLRDKPSLADLICVVFTAQSENCQRDPVFAELRRQAADMVVAELDKAGYFTEERKKP